MSKSELVERARRMQPVVQRIVDLGCDEQGIDVSPKDFAFIAGSFIEGMLTGDEYNQTWNDGTNCVIEALNGVTNE